MVSTMEKISSESSYEKDTVDKYQEKLAMFIIKELGGNRRLLRGLRTKLVGTHHGGEDLIESLNAKDEFRTLAEKISEFQKKWEEEHENWTYSCLDWANVQWLGEKLSKLLKEELKTGKGNIDMDEFCK